MQLTINIGKKELMDILLVGGSIGCCVYLYKYIREKKELKKRMEILEESKDVIVW